MGFKNCTWTLGIFAIFALAVVNAERITLDRKTDKSIDQFSNITCHYADYYQDFYWAWGCPTQIHEYGITDIDSMGFWTPCKKDLCELLYFAPNVARPSFVYLDVFIEGNGGVEVSGKRTPTFPEFYEVIERTSAGPNILCSGTIQVDLTSHTEIYALNITAISARNGYALLDKVTVCLPTSSEPECTAPVIKPFNCTNTPPTTTTTRRPDTDDASSIYMSSKNHIYSYMSILLTIIVSNFIF